MLILGKLNSQDYLDISNANFVQKHIYILQCVNIQYCFSCLVVKNV